MGEIMADKNNTEDFDMDFFNDSGDLQLNFESNPDDEGFGSDTDEEENTDEESEEIENNTTSEDQNDSEEVTGEEDQEEEGEESTDEESDDVSPDDNLYSSFASVLSEKGLLPSLDLKEKQIKTIDDLTESFKFEISNQAKQYLLDKVGEEGYEALEKGISLAEYQQHQNNIQTLDGIDDATLEGDLELAKQIIRQDYLSQGMDEVRVNRILKKSIDLGEDVILEDAKESLQSLKVIEGKRLEQVAVQREQQRLDNIKVQEKIDNDLKNSIYNEDEYFKGLKVNKNIKDKIYNSITKVVGKSPEGIAENQLMRDRREDPISFDKKLYYIYEITNGFKDINKILSKSDSKAASSLEAQLRRNKFESGDKPAFMTDPESYGGTGSELVF
jgi:hypothetical protein